VRAAAATPERLTTVQLAEAARDGDTIAAPLVRESGRYLGIAAATVINLFNPDRLILGGPLAAAGSLFVDAVSDEARRRALAVPFAAVQILSECTRQRRRSHRRCRPRPGPGIGLARQR